jgi:threonine dehydrogenase-like Zn-dependent dehydrogenase
VVNRSSLAATRHGGLVHLVGYAAGTCASFDIFEAIRHAVPIRLATPGRQSFEALVRVIERQKIKPPIDRVFPVTAFREALDYLASGGRFGKVGLKFDKPI